MSKLFEFTYSDFELCDSQGTLGTLLSLSRRCIHFPHWKPIAHPIPGQTKLPDIPHSLHDVAGVLGTHVRNRSCDELSQGFYSVWMEHFRRLAEQGESSLWKWSSLTRIRDPLLTRSLVRILDELAFQFCLSSVVRPFFPFCVAFREAKMGNGTSVFRSSYDMLRN